MIEERKHYRQGDVLLVEIDSLPDGVKPRASTVIAEGEVTGHHHVLESDGEVMVYESKNGRNLFAQILELDARLVHEEHGVIVVSPGSYEVRIQREFRPSGSFSVRD